MKKILTLLIFCFVLAGKYKAQDMPPPPPLIWAPPSETDIKEFVSKELGFKISFPGEPKLEKKQIDGVDESFLKVYRKGSNSIVRVLTYKNKVEKSRDEIVKNYRESIMNSPPPYFGAKVQKPEITSENEFKIGKYKGIEFIYKFDLRFAKVRLLFVDKRVYEIKTDVTNWHILTQSFKNKVEEFDKETKRFLDSFQLIKK
jgi:hypothetical protein